MTLSDTHVEKIKEAAERIGNYGKVILSVNGLVVDIITEERTRIQNGYKETDRAAGNDKM